MNIKEAERMLNLIPPYTREDVDKAVDRQRTRAKGNSQMSQSNRDGFGKILIELGEAQKACLAACAKQSKSRTKPKAQGTTPSKVSVPLPVPGPMAPKTQKNRPSQPAPRTVYHQPVPTYPFQPSSPVPSRRPMQQFFTAVGNVLTLLLWILGMIDNLVLKALQPLAWAVRRAWGVLRTISRIRHGWPYVIRFCMTRWRILIAVFLAILFLTGMCLGWSYFSTIQARIYSTLNDDYSSESGVFRFDSPVSTVQVFSNPWAEGVLRELKTKEQYFFTAPMRNSIDVPSGRYRLSLYRDRELLTSMIVILKGGRYEIRAQLQEDEVDVCRLPEDLW